MSPKTLFAKHLRLLFIGGGIVSSVIFVYATLAGRLPSNFWVFRCDASGYSDEFFLSYCGDPAYGFYEHYAFFNGLEPAAIDSLRNAQVVFLGNSKSERAFTASVFEKYFNAKGVPYYNLGMGAEWDVFPMKMIKRYGLRPKAVVINADYFFYNAANLSAKEVLGAEGGEPPLEGRLKKRVQYYHRKLCANAEGMLGDLLCGNGQQTHYRSNRTGRVIFKNISYKESFPSAVDETSDEPDYDLFLDNAQRFKRVLDDAGACMILTVVPWLKTDYRVAQKISDVLGVPFVRIPPDEYPTYDEGHLLPESAEKWGATFLKQAEPNLSACLRS